MNSFKKCLLLSVLLILIPGLVNSQELKKSSIEERLIRIEASQQNLEKRFDDLGLYIDRRFEGVDKRFESVDNQIISLDKRFEAIDKRFDDLRYWLQFILGAMVLMLGAIIAQWMLVWRKVDRIEASVEGRIVIGYREEEIREMRKRIETLEAALAK